MLAFNVAEDYSGSKWHIMSSPWPGWIIQLLSTEDEVAYVLDSDLRIAACNRGWDKFAVENGGVGVTAAEVIGRPIFQFIPQVLVEFYQRKYDEARRMRRWIGFDYDCSSPEKLRKFHMGLYAYDLVNLVVVNAYLPNRLPSWPANVGELSDEVYLANGALITMCANCRRSKRTDRRNGWDWVPRFLFRPPARVSHGLCPPCSSELYPFYEPGTV